MSGDRWLADGLIRLRTDASPTATESREADVATGSSAAAEPCSVLVVGAGAIGGIYAAHLCKAAEVAVLDANAAHVGAIRRAGLAVSGETDTVGRPEAAADPDAFAGRHFDFVIVAVKSAHTRAALSAVLPRLVPPAAVLSIQNGQGNVEVLAELTGADILQGLTWEAGEYAGPGRVRHLIHGKVSRIGPVRGGMAAAERLAATLRACGLPTEAVADPRGAVWTKFIFNCAMNPISALLRGIPEAKYASEDIWELLQQAVREGMAVAECEGIRLDDHPLRLIEEVRAGRLPMPRHPGSMHQDLARGQPSEIEALTGYLLRKAHQHGIPAPRHETLYQLVKGLELGLAARREAP